MKRNMKTNTVKYIVSLSGTLDHLVVQSINKIEVKLILEELKCPSANGCAAW